VSPVRPAAFKLNSPNCGSVWPLTHRKSDPRMDILRSALNSQFCLSVWSLCSVAQGRTCTSGPAEERVRDWQLSCPRTLYFWSGLVEVRGSLTFAAFLPWSSLTHPPPTQGLGISNLASISNMGKQLCGAWGGGSKSRGGGLLEP
jgi:hypothetical protein